MSELKPGECRWISVSERLPKKEFDVYDVKFRSGAFGQLRFYYGKFVSPRDEKPWDGTPITHWLEVCPPEAPKRKVKKEGYVRFRDIHSSCHVFPQCVKVTYEVDENDPV